jgi:hypothetical protein
MNFKTKANMSSTIMIMYKSLKANLPTCDDMIMYEFQNLNPHVMNMTMY